MKTKVTRRQADKALRLVKKQFASWIDGPDSGPTLDMEWGWPSGGPTPSIVWEGGPFEWTQLFPYGGTEEEFHIKIEPVELPEGVWVEPYSHFAVCLYPL